MSHFIDASNNCVKCGRTYRRQRYPSGRFEQMAQFSQRRFCSHACSVKMTGAERALDFWQRVDKSGGESACWPWTAAINSGGYGSAGVEGRVVTASRRAYELTNGPIPRGEGYHGNVVMHSCDNRPCCNPRHLSLGTQGDNNNDRDAKGRGWWQRRPICEGVTA